MGAPAEAAAKPEEPGEIIFDGDYSDEIGGRSKDEDDERGTIHEPDAHDGDGEKIHNGEPKEQEGQEGKEGEEQEGREPRLMRDPSAPTKAESERHSCVHLPSPIMVQIQCPRQIGQQSAPQTPPQTKCH